MGVRRAGRDRDGRMGVRGKLHARRWMDDQRHAIRPVLLRAAARWRIDRRIGY